MSKCALEHLRCLMESINENLSMWKRDQWSTVAEGFQFPALSVKTFRRIFCQHNFFVLVPAKPAQPVLATVSNICAWRKKTDGDALVDTADVWCFAFCPMVTSVCSWNGLRASVDIVHITWHSDDVEYFRLRLVMAPLRLCPRLMHPIRIERQTNVVILTWFWSERQEFERIFH